MKKSTKLLSVILAIIMIFSSMSVLASAAKANYKTVADLTANEAYDTYGAVTRLSTEERMSIVLDFLDNTLGNIPNSSMTIPVLNINVNYGSVNGLLKTIDDITGHTLVGTAIGVASKDNLLKSLQIDYWKKNCRGMTREGTDQLVIIGNLLRFLNDNAPAVKKLLDTGSLELGLLNGALGSIRDQVNAIVKDVPGFVKGMLYPMMERKDDTTDQINYLLNTNNTADAVLTSFVQGLFTKPQSTTTYKEDAAGNCVSDHTLPTTPGTRTYYVKSGDQFTCYVYDTEKSQYVAEPDVFVRTAEKDSDGNPTGYYTYNKIIDGKPADGLKYYKNGSYWLPSLVKSGKAAEIMNISTNSGANMLYQMIPYVFAEMAPVVLNGSVKKLFAELLGTKFTYIGEVDSAEVKALSDYNASEQIFKAEKLEYLWESSDYAVISGNHYYRFEDQIYAGDINDVNKYFSLINWNWKVTGNELNEFMPGADGQTPSQAGYTTLFQALNDFVAKVIDIAATDDLKAIMGWEKGDNSKLIPNIKKAARAVLPIEPEIIFGSNYADPDKYYDLIMNGSDQEILVGVACTLLDFLMPQLILPKADTIKGNNVKLGAILAAVIRELATQFLPTYNYDDLIYADYNNKTFVAGKENSYWLNVCLTMGVDIGMSYLRNLADLGEDKVAEGGYQFAASKEYKLASFNETGWEATVDWIIDWALNEDYEWCWSMGGLVDITDGGKLTTTENPWKKLGEILNNILPVTTLLNVDTNDSLWLEKALKDNFVLAILDLKLEKITGSTAANGIFNIPINSTLRTQPLLPAVVNLVRDLLNGLLYKVAGYDNLIDATRTKDTIESVYKSTNAVQDNLGILAQNLIQKLYVAKDPLLKAALPIVNFFLGWITDAQKFADPTLIFSNEGGKSYIYTSTNEAKTTLKITNNSAGMLQKHRNSDVEDKDYILVIDGVGGDFTTTQSFPIRIMPYGTASFEATMPYTEERGVKIYLYYHFELKDGTKLADSSLRSTTYQVVSNREQDSQLNSSHTEGIEVKGGTFNLYKIVTYQGVASPMNPLVTSSAALSSTVSGLDLTLRNRRDKDATVTGLEYSGYDTAYIAPSGKESEVLNTTLKASPSQDKPEGDPVSYNPATLVTGAPALPSGSIIALGSVKSSVYCSVNDKKTGSVTNNFGNLYYMNLEKLTKLYNNELSAKRKAAGHSESAWAAYEQAMMNTAAMVLAPVSMAGFAEKYSDANIDALYNALSKAVDDLLASEDASSSATSASVKGTLQPILDACEGGSELNYQDYELYEYWAYERVRNEARSMIAASERPEAPDAYIEGSNLSEQEIRDVASAEANTLKSSAIINSMKQPTDKEKKAYEDMMKTWAAPYYSDLKIADISTKLPYYKNFMVANAKVTENQFLDTEIAYAKAQNYVAAEYSADSWAAYQAALATAEKVQAKDKAALQSEVFNAKYELMKAQNELLRKEKSVKEGTYLDDLKALVAQAEIIFNYSQYYAPKADVTAADAYAALIKALGYTYQDADGYDQILYSRSAAEFLKYDRENTATNLARIEAAEVALKAAIDNFECTIKLVENDGDQTTAVAQGVKIINGITPGSIANIDALMNHVKASAPEAVATPFASASGFFGTGAKVDLSIEGIGVLTTYYVVIYGDVNGDGAIDAFDAAIVNQNINTGVKLSGVYKDAAMVTRGDDVELADYSAIFGAAVGAQEIEQNRA